MLLFFCRAASSFPGSLYLSYRFAQLHTNKGQDRYGLPFLFHFLLLCFLFPSSAPLLPLLSASPAISNDLLFPPIPPLVSSFCPRVTPALVLLLLLHLLRILFFFSSSSSSCSPMSSSSSYSFSSFSLAALSSPSSS